MTPDRPLRISKRIRNHHRKERLAGHTTLGLRPWARQQAEKCSTQDREASPAVLDKKRGLSTPALAWHRLAGRP